jgi:hypothetical protein
MLLKMMKMLHLHGSDFTRIHHSKSSLLDTASCQFSSFFQALCFLSVGLKEEKLTPSLELHIDDISD